jgi:tyrosyl-tRNA synthetase
VPDADVEKFLFLFTFLPAEEVRELGRLEGQELNRAKEVLAFELTKIVHGEEEAAKAKEAARAAFSSAGGGADTSAIPSIDILKSELEKGINAVTLFAMTDLCSSNGEARRLITQGGARINEKKIESVDAVIDTGWIEEGGLMLKAGKKRYFAVNVTDG